MSPPPRRSRRLQACHGKATNHASDNLESLTERDETPIRGAQSNLDEILSSPLLPHTPATPAAGRMKASLAEMHPSKVHQSTAQKPESALRLGFSDIPPNGANSTRNTPSKIGIGPAAFEFRFAPPTQLGPEAQRMMEDLREEALKIKARLAAERDEQKRLEGDNLFGEMAGRKFAQAKGKVGRYSDLHMAEFKKMDSIEGHPSSFRAQPGRSAAVMGGLKRSQSKAKLEEREAIQAITLQSERTGAVTDTLKRTRSKAKMDDYQESQGGFAQTARVTPAVKNLKRTQSRANLDDRETVHFEQIRMERLENTTPAKRARQQFANDILSVKYSSNDATHGANSAAATPAQYRSHQGLLASLTTPTQASLARTAIVKQPSTQIPNLSRSPSKSTLANTSTPRGLTKSATMSSIPKPYYGSPLRSLSKFDRVKSILRHPSSSMKKATAIQSLATSPNRPNLDKVLPSLPVELGRSNTAKHVNFAQSTVNKPAATVKNTGSPMKSGIPRSTSKFDLGPKIQYGGHIQSNEIKYPKLIQPQEVQYPSLNSSLPSQTPGETESKPRPPPPSVPGTFTFRSDHTISFGTSPNGFGSSPGQASLRQVRPSIFPIIMPGTYPEGNKENDQHMPSIPHGMSNKKRRRVESDDEEDEDAERCSKKHKAVAEGDTLMAPTILAEKMAPKSMIPSPAKKKGLSLSRLNMLARPKMRK